MINSILDKYINNERGTDFANYTPDGIKQLLLALGNPHFQFKTVHIAGTNGKGSTCYMIARTLEAAGYRTGLFISPHLIKINERISINSSEISDVELLNNIQKADQAANKFNITATYFDILTAAAFCYFRDQHIDIAVIETGLGGRLDSTNVITPEVSVITDISMDHTHILGNTLEKITEEKCGIIKPGIPVISTNTDILINDIIRKYSKKIGSEFYEYNTTIIIEKISSDTALLNFKFSFMDFPPFLIELPLFPEHQIKNAAASAAALLTLKTKKFNSISPEIIISSMKNIKIPGRFQRLSFRPVILFDPAHNISSLCSLFNSIKSLYPRLKNKIVLTMMKDKVTDEIYEFLDSEKDKIIYYVKDDPRVYIPMEKQFSLITGDKNLILNHLKTEIDSNTIILFTGTFRIYDFALDAARILSE